MSKPITKVINNFSLGMPIDPRDEDKRHAQLVKNFDAHSFKHKLIPFRASEDGDSDGNNSRKQNFCIGYDGSNYNLYSLGQISSASSLAEVRSKALTTGASNDLDDNTWATPANNQQSTGGAVNGNLFVHYRKTNKIYLASGTQYLRSFSPTGGAWNDTEVDLTSFTTVCQGVVHSKDDILYIGYDNKIAKNNNGSWTAAALTLPTHLTVSSICAYGNYLAIGCKPSSGLGGSVVYLWDRDSSLATLSESIDWGEGLLTVLEEIDGRLFGVSLLGNSTIKFRTKIIIRAYTGVRAEVVRELGADVATYTVMPLAKQKVDNNLYFLLSITINGTLHEGLWKFGRSAEGYSLTFDRPANNDTALTSGTLNGFYIVGDYVFIAYISSSAYDVTKTLATATYTATSAYETTVQNEGDSSVAKKLIGVTVFTEPLPTAGQVVLKYKIDAETSFTTVFTHTTDNSVAHSAINIESSGANLPEYKELTLRVESTGGAIVTGIRYKFEVIDKDVY